MNVVGAVILWLAIAFAVACLAAFCVMMGVQNMHEWWNFIPTMGFWHAFSITVWFSVPLSIYASHSSSRD